MFKYVFWLCSMAFLICTGLIIPLTVLFFMWAFLCAPNKWFGDMQDNNVSNDGVGD